MRVRVPRALLASTAALLLLAACGGSSASTTGDSSQAVNYKSSKGLDIAFKRAGNQVSGITGSVSMTCGAGDLLTFSFVVPGSLPVTGNTFGGTVNAVISDSKVRWKIQGTFDANGHAHGTYSEETNVLCSSGLVPWEADPH